MSAALNRFHAYRLDRRGRPLASCWGVVRDGEHRYFHKMVSAGVTIAQGSP